MIELARQFGRYGYRRIAALLRDAGWSVSDGRIERLWRREGLKVPQKPPKKGRLDSMTAHAFGCALSIAIKPGEKIKGNGWTIQSCKAPHAQPLLECMAFAMTSGGKNLFIPATLDFALK